MIGYKNQYIEVVAHLYANEIEVKEIRKQFH